MSTKKTVGSLVVLAGLALASGIASLVATKQLSSSFSQELIEMRENNDQRHQSTRSLARDEVAAVQAGFSSGFISMKARLDSLEASMNSMLQTLETLESSSVEARDLEDEVAALEEELSKKGLKPGIIPIEESPFGRGRAAKEVYYRSANGAVARAMFSKELTESTRQIAEEWFELVVDSERLLVEFAMQAIERGSARKFAEAHEALAYAKKELPRTYRVERVEGQFFVVDTSEFLQSEDHAAYNEMKSVLAERLADKDVKLGSYITPADFWD